MDDLTALRDLVDQTNLVLRDTLQLRARLVGRIAAIKASRGLPAIDPGREAEMIARLLVDPPPGFDDADLRRIFEAILVASRGRVARAASPEGGDPSAEQR